MITQGPFSIVTGTPLVLPDPAATHGSQSTKIQIQNTTPALLTVTAGITIVSMPGDMIQTVTLPGDGTAVTVLPTTGIAAGAGSSINVVWLLAGESAPQIDGPVSANTITAISPAPTLSAYQSSSNGSPAGILIGGANTQITIFSMWLAIVGSNPIGLSYIYNNKSGLYLLAAYNGPTSQGTNVSLAFPGGIIQDISGNHGIYVVGFPSGAGAIGGITYAVTVP